MDCSAIVLNKLLQESNLDVWARLKLAFLDPAYASLYSAVSRHYEKYNKLPTFDELELVCREGTSQKTLAIVKLVDEPDIDATVALDALLDQYTQDQTLDMLDKFIDKLPLYDSEEIKHNLSDIVMKLDEKTLTSESVYTMADMVLFQTDDQLSRDRSYLGINNILDSTLNGVARQELILIGGQRGSGKSITSSNIAVNQYESGFSTVIFTIEMLAREVNERNFAIMADVPYMHIKQNTLTDLELLKVVKARAGMFDGADDLVEQFLSHRDRFRFEQELLRTKSLKSNNQIVIVDDRALSLASIDLHLGKLKARFGDSLKVAVVDYMNQVVMDGNGIMLEQFDWQRQTIVSKKLKELARKHDVVMVSPYQIDASGEARFAKGILDAADIALVMEAHDKAESAVSFHTTKIRGGPPISFTSGINWDTLRISPVPIEKPETKSKKTTRSKDEPSPPPSGTDIPWN